MTEPPPATVAPPNIDVIPVAATPTVTPAPAATTASPKVPETAASSPNSVQNNPSSTLDESKVGTSDSNTSGDATATSEKSIETPTPTAPAAAASATPESKPSSSSSAPSTSEMNSLDSTSGLSTETGGKVSSLYVNVSVIAGAVVGVVLVALFIARRVKQRREQENLKSPDDSDKEFNLQVDRGATPAYMMSAAPVAAGRGRGGSSGAGRPVRASSTSDMPSLLSMDSLASSTVEFANTQYGLPSEPSSNASRTTNASYATSIVSSNPTRPMRPQSVVEEDKEYHTYSARKQSVGAATVAQPPPPRPLHQPVYQGVRRKSSAISLTSGNTYEDEYDIVVPGTLRDADRRNTETLVKDGRFGQFSNFSEQDVRSVHDDRFFAKEHEI